MSERIEQIRNESDQKFAAAVRLSSLSLEEIELLGSRTLLRDDHSYEFEVAPWQLPSDASVELSVARDDESQAAALLLDAGLGFTRVSEASGLDHDFRRALVCLSAAANFARRVTGPEARKIEVRAAHTIAYMYLTQSELAGDKKRTRTSNELAARYFELEGFWEFQQDNQQRSADSYANARHRYQLAGRFEESARAADKESERFQALSNSQRAGEAQIVRANMLFEATKRGNDRRLEPVSALLAAARLLAEGASERLRAAEVVLGAARKALEILQAKPNSSDASFQRTAAESLSKARAMFEGMDEFAKADACHYLRRRIHREQLRRLGWLAYMSPGFLMSLLLDVSWAYGTRPLRLVRTAAVVILVFSALYFLIGGAQWGNRTAGVGYASRALAAVVLSVTSLLPAQLLERIAKLQLLPVVMVGRVGEVLVLLESAVGLGLMAMAVFSAGRWVKRLYLPGGV